MTTLQLTFTSLGTAWERTLRARPAGGARALAGSRVSDCSHSHTKATKQNPAVPSLLTFPHDCICGLQCSQGLLEYHTTQPFLTVSPQGAGLWQAARKNVMIILLAHMLQSKEFF